MKRIFPFFLLVVLIVGCGTNTSIQSNTMNANQTSFSSLQKAVLHTSMGDITVELATDDAPKTVENFLKLTRDDFYNGTKFHRVIADFMIQGGDPNSKDEDVSTWGMGGPGYAFEDEINSQKLVRGSLAMANSGPDTNGSQFFIVTAESTPWLDGKHTNFGRVIEGMDVVLTIEKAQTVENDRPATDVVLESVEVVE